MHNQRMLDWSNLQYFLAVAREGSTLAASKVLCVNQSTVHRRVAELEQHLGYPLVERHPTGYRLTNFGQESGHILSEGGAVDQLFPSRSCSFDHRRRPDTFRTAIATALFCPTITTSFLPRVTPV